MLLESNSGGKILMLISIHVSSVIRRGLVASLTTNWTTVIISFISISIFNGSISFIIEMICIFSDY